MNRLQFTLNLWQARWCRWTEPAWCRERHAETLEILHETACELEDAQAEVKRLRSRLATKERDESRESLHKTCGTIDSFARAVSEHGMPRVQSIALPAVSRYSLYRSTSDLASVSGTAFLEPDGLRLLGIRIHFRPDIAPGAFMVEMGEE